MSSLAAGLVAVLGGCSGVPDGLEPVHMFEPGRYVGRWYEIARLDHRFERGLVDVTADYALAPDGSELSVINRGYDPDEEVWQQVEGTAKFRQGPDVASLSVTFFWPFAGGYHVLSLDPEYRWALVCGSDRDQLWILARSPDLPPQDVRDELVARASAWGFPVDELIWVPHGVARSNEVK